MSLFSRFEQSDGRNVSSFLCSNREPGNLKSTEVDNLMEALFDSAGGALYSSAETSGNRIHSTPGDSAAYFHAISSSLM
ncbi:uncharacterized protein LAJ45_03695 [Morchella importuna]|uniref:uncharacterized protein n=1 Tax=Morchella importuna TaxID=1174673 RepID=UPI001E8EC76E|nr:uncharacterized protein LAJ45_03695 [Morchella importuna]KAH8152269.1 hypothetical protein LAJ45_03695 [Morchella importuna]